MGGQPPPLGPSAVVPADPTPVVTPPPATQDDVSGPWWQRYRSALGPKLSCQAIGVLEADARYIVSKALPFVADAPDVSAWPEHRVRTGMVVGSVQSGKTASMLGVAALALDLGVDIIILLAGTRVGLWLQTYERLLAQLDGSTPEDAFRRRDERLILPQPDDVLNEQRADAGRYLQRPLGRLALKAARPIILVIPKEDDHLLALRRFLLDIVTEPYLNARQTPLSMLLLDDEADDASVLDSDSSQKVTPRLITALWSGDTDLAGTRHPNLLASYVAYTATPQANFLQATHNPLTPRDFNAALRTPGATGAATPRSLSFTEPSGVSGYYCGGEMFYERLMGLGGASLCRSFPFPILGVGESSSELAERHDILRWKMLSDALRSYMVGAAVRLYQARGQLRYDRQVLHDSAASARAASPPPHTMLLHPSARKDDHFQAAADIVRWSMADPGAERSTSVPGEEAGQPELVISAEGLSRRLDIEDDAWKAWLSQFEASRIALSTLPNAPYSPISSSSWPTIRTVLKEKIFPSVALRVLNSDPASDDRPRFDPERVNDGYRIAPDLLSIFVAGNVLSRGLTLEGLATSLFLRGAAEPAADTQMQMQRWFGYRGTLLPFCRVMTFDDQLQLFRNYHVNDNALKTEVLAKMEGGYGSDMSAILVLQGAAFVATSKVESRKVPLSPGPRPSVRIVETSDKIIADANVGLLVDLRADGDWVPLLDDNGRQRGLVRTEPVDLNSLADILDRFRYAQHDPDLANELSQRWIHYQASLGLGDSLFRPPGEQPLPYATDPQSCPYSIAAYLRLWSALRNDRHAPGFYPTDRPEVPWGFSDASQSASPHFYLAIRNGEHQPRDARLRDAGVRSLTRQLSPGGRALQTLWGTRGYGGSYFGDELIDYYHHRTSPIPSIQGGASWRPRGHPGLALFHLIREPSAPNDLVAVGLGLPHGGPDHIAALRL